MLSVLPIAAFAAIFISPKGHYFDYAMPPNIFFTAD